MTHTIITNVEPPSTIDGSTSAPFHNGARGRFNAWFFARFDRYIAHIAGEDKQAVFGDLQPGTIVEIGAGVGANFDFIPEGSHLAAIEPNRAMHPRLLARAAARGIHVELHDAGAEDIPLDDSSVDDVLCSLVLCTVEDQDAVLAEIRRILRPGGRFRYVEHVEAGWRSPRRWLQRTLRAPWSWVSKAVIFAETPLRRSDGPVSQRSIRGRVAGAIRRSCP